MSKSDDFSLEQSEELLANLKSGAPSEFEQLRSALNLLGHVTELPRTSIPPLLPSGISQPVPIIAVKSIKSRRTIITSVIVTGILASASLAAAAVTGIGPAPIVNIGHQTAKFVKGVAGAVTHVVTGGNSNARGNQPEAPRVPGMTPAPTNGDNSSSDGGTNANNESDSGSLNLQIPLIPNALTSEAKKSSDSKGGNGKSDGNNGSNTSHESQSPNSQDSLSVTLPPSPIASFSLSTNGEKEHTNSGSHSTPLQAPTALPSPNPSDQSNEND